MLKKIGSKAREDMERFFGCKINLRLWVKDVYKRQLVSFPVAYKFAVIFAPVG